jgi:phosphoserine phosphatase RsbU/P
MSAAPPRVMQCMEVWGGNAAIEHAVTMAGLNAWVFSRPYQNADAGGDIYYLSACASDRILRLLIADVSGHGEAVNQIATQLRTLMRRYVNCIDHVQFVKRMNGHFTQHSKSGIFATAVVMSYFAPTRRLTIVNAGHPRPLLYRAREKRWILLHRESESDEPVNLPLGIIDLADYETFDETLGDGDFVLCHTDSLIEARDATGNQLGQAGLLRLINDIPIGPPQEMIATLIARVAQLAPDNLDDDDVTALLFAPNDMSGKFSRFGHRLVGSMRGLGAVIYRVCTGAPDPPFPDWSLANMGGRFFSPLNRLWRAKSK